MRPGTGSWNVTLTEAVRLLPAVSQAVATSRFAPGRSATSSPKLPSAPTPAATPFTETCAPTSAVPATQIEDSYRRLHEAHAFVLFPDTSDVWMAHPWCFSPTPHRVEAAGRVWTATCAWDALGIPGTLHGDGRIESECACCGEPVTLVVRDGVVADGGDLLVHLLVPVRRWWEDIGFT